MSWLLEIELILLPTNKIKLLDSSKHTYKTKLHQLIYKKYISLRFFWQFFYVMVALICFPEHCELSFSLLSSLLLQSWCAWEQWLIYNANGRCLCLQHNHIIEHQLLTIGCSFLRIFSCHQFKPYSNQDNINY